MESESCQVSLHHELGSDAVLFTPTRDTGCRYLPRRAWLLAGAVLLLPLEVGHAAGQATDTTTLATQRAAETKSKAVPLGATPASQNAGGEIIVVTAARRAQRIKDVPESISVITAAQIRSAPAQTLDNVLRATPSLNLPSINVSDNFPTNSYVGMRGLAGPRALVLLDGIPLNDLFFGSIQWNRVPIETVSQIEIARGGDATLWGNYAMGGVVNIITQAPTKNELLVSGGAGSYGTYRANLYGAYLPTPWIRLNADYGYNQTLGYDEVPEDIRRPIDRKTESFAHNFMANADVDLTDQLTAGARVNYNSTSEPIQITSKSTNYSRQLTFSGFVKQTFDDNSTLTGSAFHDSAEFYTNNTAIPSFITDNSFEYVQNSHHTPAHDIGGSMVYNSRIPGYVDSYAIGADVHETTGIDKDFLYSDNTGTIASAGSEFGGGKQIFAGGFGQISLKPIDPLYIMFSARYQYYESYDASHLGVAGTGAFASNESFSFLPRLSVRYKLDNMFAVRAAAYESFRAPTMDQLYRDVTTPTGEFLSNPNLRPEKLKGGELGFDFDLGPLTGQVTGFYNHITNVITSRDLQPDELRPGFYFGGININAGSAESRGFKAEAHYRIMPGLSALLGYTYADSPITADSTDPGAVGRQQADVPKHKFSASLTYVGPGGWSVTPELLYLSQQYGDDDHTMPINQHVVVDLTGSYPVTPKLEVFVQAQNIFNRTYIGLADGGSPPLLGEPITIFAGLRYRVF